MMKVCMALCTVSDWVEQISDDFFNYIKDKSLDEINNPTEGKAYYVLWYKSIEEKKSMKLWAKAKANRTPMAVRYPIWDKRLDQMRESKAR